MNVFFYLVGLVVLAIIVFYALGHWLEDAAFLPAKTIRLGYLSPLLVSGDVRGCQSSR